MALTLNDLKKWSKMILGKSELHVNQGLGKKFNPKKIEGYFNDMTEKVEKWIFFDEDGIPLCKKENKELFYFPVAIFQYGLGAYDKFLIFNDKKYFNIFTKCIDWALKNQEINGGWKNFDFIYPDKPYSAMAQGEAISLMVRANISNYKKEETLSSIKKAKFFLLDDKQNYEISKYDNSNNLLLYEYSYSPLVLNGWIFAFFGLYDFYLLEKNKENKNLIDKSLQSIGNYIENFDLDNWSKYDMENKITSKFYHNLQISQLKALYLISKNKNFKEISERWEKGLNDKRVCFKYFLIKAYQKIVE